MKQYKLFYKIIHGLVFNEDKNIFDFTSIVPGEWEVHSFQFVDIVRPSEDPRTHVYHLAILCVRELD
ncbi:hypothetical protein IX318_000084 [Porphyromonas levii]|nr:hypothetical protein [Porphyromonas levii]MBR8714249.1 hypothetical protein [Porphyromonas levii]MBR8726791.1 hypothetical protein [Porphyromonas levii]MBR8735096.1 hypothetical protein [Porphyromonas levii]MBR8759006.1 hypothetical protein [Porphyromonas levii]